MCDTFPTVGDLFLGYRSDTPQYSGHRTYDIGQAELGAYGGEIANPAIDSLADTGARYTSFCARSNCSPTCAMLLTGEQTAVVHDAQETFAWELFKRRGVRQGD